MAADALDELAALDAEYADLAERFEALDAEVARLAERFHCLEGRLGRSPLADDDGEYWALIPSRERAELAILAMAARLEAAAPYMTNRRGLQKAGYGGFGIDQW